MYSAPRVSFRVLLIVLTCFISECVHAQITHITVRYTKAPGTTYVGEDGAIRIWFEGDWSDMTYVGQDANMKYVYRHIRGSYDFNGKLWVWVQLDTPEAFVFVQEPFDVLQGGAPIYSSNEANIDLRGPSGQSGGFMAQTNVSVSNNAGFVANIAGGDDDPIDPCDVGPEHPGYDPFECDTDDDGIVDICDPDSSEYNPLVCDNDCDGIVNVCDADSGFYDACKCDCDGDGLADAEDPEHPNFESVSCAPTGALITPEWPAAICPDGDMYEGPPPVLPDCDGDGQPGGGDPPPGGGGTPPVVPNPPGGGTPPGTTPTPGVPPLPPPVEPPPPPGGDPPLPPPGDDCCEAIVYWLEYINSGVWNTADQVFESNVRLTDLRNSFISFLYGGEGAGIGWFWHAFQAESYYNSDLALQQGQFDESQLHTLLLNQILAAIDPGVFNPSVTGLIVSDAPDVYDGEELTLTEEIDGARDDVTYDLPTVVEGGVPVWSVDIPVPDLGLGASGGGTINADIDWSFFAPFRTLVHSLMILSGTIWAASLVWEEVRRYG